MDNGQQETWTLKTMSQKAAFHALNITASVFAVMCLVAFVYLRWYETPYLSYENLPFPTEKPEVRHGEIVSIVVKRCNSSSETRSYMLVHELRRVGSEQEFIALPSMMVAIKPGCETAISSLRRIPLDAQLGQYVITGVAVVDGTLRTHNVPFESLPFEVIP